MAVNEEILLDIKVQNSDALANIEKLSDANEVLKNRIKLLDAAIKEGTISEKDSITTKAVINAQIKENSAGIRENSKELKTNAASVASAGDSINGMRARVADLQKSYNSLSTTARESSVGKAISAEMLSLNTNINKANVSVGNFKDNIGNYAGTLASIPGPIGEIGAATQQTLGIMSDGYGKVKDIIKDYIASIAAEKGARALATAANEAATVAEKELSLAKEEGTATSEQQATAEALRATATVAAAVATDVSSASLKLFKIALASTGIGAIVVLLGSLVAYFTQTETGARTLTKVTAAMGAIFKEFTGFLAKGVQHARDFIDGIKSFPDLMSKIGTAIETNLLNRLKSVGTLFSGLVDIMKGDFIKGGKEVVDGLGGIGTGVLNITDKIGDAGKKIGAAVSDAAAGASKIADMQERLDKYKSASIVSLQQLETNMQKYEAILGKAGQSMTTKERENAVNQVLEDEEKIAAIKLNIARQTTAVKKAQYQLDLKANSDVRLQELTDYRQAQADEIKIAGESALTKQNASARGAKLYQQMLNEQISAEQKTYDYQKTLINDQLKNKQLSTDDQIALLEKLRSSEDTNFKQQSDSFQAYNDSLANLTKTKAKTIDINSLLEISDGKLLAQKMTDMGVSVKAQAQLLTLIDARRTELESINQQELTFRKENATKLISDLQNELQIYQLHDKEVNAGKVLTHQQEIDELVKTYDTEQKQLDIKHESGLLSEKEYGDAQKILDQKFNTDKAESDAAFAEKQLSQKAEQLANELSLIQENSDDATAIKKQQLKLQQDAEIKAAGNNGDLVLSINKKYAKLQKQVDKDSSDYKLDQAKRITDGVADLFGKTTKAGKAAASASVAIDTYKGAQSAIAGMAGAGPVGWALGAVEAGVIIAGGIKSIADIWKVSEDSTTSVSGSSTQSATASSGTSTIYTNLPNINSMYTSTASQNETSQIIAQSQPNPVVRVTEITDMQNTVAVKENSKI